MIEYAVTLIAACATLSLAQPFISNFDSGIEGWSVETHTSPAGAFSLVSTFVPDFVTTGGDVGPHIAETDPDAEWSFFVSPDSWSGDLSRFLDRRLRYSTRTDTNNYPDGRLVILTGAGGATISHDAGIPDLNVWTRRETRLSEGNWYIGTTASGTPASESLITAILSDFESLLIGLEFGGDVAEERVDLDSVAFGLCDADLNDDGQVDFFDVSALLTAYNAQDPLADLNGDGLFDFFDISAFLGAYATGCP